MALELAEVVGHLSELQRFPVEPLGGESPNAALLGSGGLIGDRVYDLCDAESGQPLTASLTPLLLLYRARYSEDLIAHELERWMHVRTPAGKEYAMSDREWLAEIAHAIGRPVSLSARPASTEASLHLVSRQTLKLAERTYGAPLEPQRLRANLVIEIGDGKAFDENRWIGRKIRIGEAFLEISGVSANCIVTTFRSDSPAGDPELLSGLVKVRGGHFGVTVRVVAGSRLRAGDPVVLVD